MKPPTTISNSPRLERPIGLAEPLLWAALALGGGALTVYFANAAYRTFEYVVPTYGFGSLALGLAIIGLYATLSSVRWNAAALFGILLAVYTTWGLISDAQPWSDFATFSAQVRLFVAEPSFELLHDTKTPGTVLWYSLFAWIGGPTTAVLRFGGAVAWALAAVCFRSMFVASGLSDRAATFGALLFGLGPGIVVYSAVVSAEAVLVLGLGFGFASLLRKRQSERWAILDYFLASASFGLAYLAVPSAAFFFFPSLVMLVVYDFKAARVRRVDWRLVVAFGLPFALIMGSQTLLNYQYDGKLSPSPSPFLQMALLQGTNQETNGAWSKEDMELAGFYGPNEVPFDQASANAWRIGLQRIAKDPTGFVTLAVDRKVERLWAREDQLLSWALRESEEFRDSIVESGARGVILRSINGYHGTAMLVLSVALLWAVVRRRLTLQVLPVLAGVCAVSVMFIFLTVQQRYHLIVMPFAYGLIAWAGSSWWRTGSAAFGNWMSR